MSQISAKNILISGASSGIGESLALAYAASNVNLFLCARNQDRLNEVKRLCELKGAKVLVNAFDVRDKKAASNFIDEIERNFAIDLVIANAGISGGEIGNKETRDDAERIFSTNFDGVLNLIHPAIEYMKGRQCGQIAMVSSLAGFCGIPSSAAYSASKAAVRVYGEILRSNLKRFKIKVSVICPGYVETTMTRRNEFWMPFLMPVNKAAQIIKESLACNKSRIVFPLSLYFVLQLAAMMPRVLVDFIFAKIAQKQTK